MLQQPSINVRNSSTSRSLQLRIVVGKIDRKSTRLNSSHLVISYAVFCLKKKNAKTSNSQGRFASDETRSAGLAVDVSEQDKEEGGCVTCRRIDAREPALWFFFF